MITRNILLIEDDALIGMFLSELLEGEGHTVCAVAASEAEAVAAAAKHQPDLMIVDVNLREGSGISAVSQINMARFVPHIFVTGDPHPVEAAFPGEIVIQKPFSLQTLTLAIGRLDGRWPLAS